MADSNKATVDAIVRNYLLSRGYEKAAAEMELELNRPKDDAVDENVSKKNNGGSNGTDSDSMVTLLSSQVLSTVIQDIVILGVNSGNYRIYDDEYSSLRSWSLTSLDLIKSEVLLLLMPTFVHCYIGLVRLGCTEEALRFWHSWEKDHHEGHAEELKSLSMLTAPEQLLSSEFLCANTFIHQALLSRFIVKISSFAYSLLTTFIVQNNLLLVASVMNDRMTFSKTTDFPGSSHTVVQLESCDLYSSSSNKGAVRNAEPIKLTAPGRGGDHKDDALSREWINLLVRPRVMLRQRDKDVIKSVGRNDHSADRRDDDEKDDKKKARFHSSLGAAAGSSRSKEVTATGNALNPSVIFSTITNASEGMTCLHISKGVTRAAAGFKDSCLRVWPLNEKDDSIAKFGSLVDGKWTMSTVLPALPTKGSAKSSTPSNNTSSGDGRTKKSSMRGILELYGHSKAIYGVCQSSDDDCRLVLSCSADETIRLWDTSIAQCVAKYSCVGPSWGVSFSPLGYYFASANQAMTAAVYSTDRIAPLRLFTGHTSDVTAVCWHENATLIASSSDDKTARLWDIRSGKCVRLFVGSPSPLSCIALASTATTAGTASLLAAGTDAGSICLWDVGTGRHMAVMNGHTDTVHSVAFNSDSNALVSGGADCALRIFDINFAVTAQSSFTAPLPASAVCPSSSSRLLNCSSSTKQGAVGVPVVCQPRHTYHTKFSPVYFVDYTDKNLVYSGGPFSLYCATTRGAGEGQATSGENKDSGRSFNSSLTATEQETAAALGLTQSVISS